MHNLQRTTKTKNGYMMVSQLAPLLLLPLLGGTPPSSRRHRPVLCHAFAPAPIARRESSSSPSSPQFPRRRRGALAQSRPSASSSDGDRYHTPRDVLIIGGGLAGLSVAHYIATNMDRHVTVLERETPEEQRARTTAASFAAAGMLAPQSERLPAGPLLELCLRSREMYGEWVRNVERGAREASLGVRSKGGGMFTGEGARYLWDLNHNDDDDLSSSALEAWETGFRSTGGFLAPAFAGDAVATWSPQPGSGRAHWLDDVQVRELEPRLHPDVIGGWWFPEDASIDARRLTCSLRAACAGAGVQMNFGPEWEVKSLEVGMGTCEGVRLANGAVYAPRSVIVANGSWVSHLLPMPVTPHKGQSLSLRMPAGAPPMLSRVLFAQDTYIVPKADGRIIVGATVEPGRFDGDVTPVGMMHCLSEATRLVPGLADLPIEESWAGLRPTTPDKCPILGITEQWDNIYVAGGYWRNGVLLAPKTGQLIGDLIANNGDAAALPEEDRALLSAFSWERFTAPGGGTALAANARYAATFYPVHRRSADGVAASVGTELGFYESAAAARGDREKDRRAMFGESEGGEEALERAAGMGVRDVEAFSLGDGDDGWMLRREKGGAGNDRVVDSGETMAVEADPDAPTVERKEEASVEDETTAECMSLGKDDAPSDLPSIYERIRANKARALESIEMGEDPTEERVDPGFRIYHVDSNTREIVEVPPFTSPGEFFQMKADGVLGSKPPPSEKSSAAADAIISEGSEVTKPSRRRGDQASHSAIREAYGEGTTAEATAEATRRARMRNRVKTSEIDESKMGGMRMRVPSKSLPPEASLLPLSTRTLEKTLTTRENLSSVYDRIRANKALANQSIEMADARENERPKLNFTIYHVESDTRDVREVPQYTSPGEFLASIAKEKAVGQTVVNGAKIPQAAFPISSSGEGEPVVAGNSGADREIAESNEKTLDGYQAILSANSASSREEELRRMKEARMMNRAKASRIMGD